MALIICPECKKEVSSKAKTCPNCGAPISESITIPVHFFRIKKLNGAGLSGTILVDGVLVGSADNNTSFEAALTPGNHILTLEIGALRNAFGQIVRAGGRSTTTNISIPEDTKSVEIEIAFKDGLNPTLIIKNVTIFKK